MSDGREDEALSWAGDDDPTLDPQGERAASHLAPGWKVVGKPGEADLGGDVAVSAEVSAATPTGDEAAPGAVLAEAPATLAPVAAPTTAKPQATPVRKPRRAAAATAGIDEAETTGSQDRTHEQMSSPMLVTLGIFGGVFLLYAVGWTISAFGPDVPPPADIVGATMFQLGQVLAVLAGPVWMATTLWLTSRSKPWFRIAMLVIGVVVLVPWPFLRGV